MSDWDYQTDFVVIGSGGGGMTAAITAKQSGLDCLVIEKSDVYGGTTAMSGGVIWIPNNPKMKAAGIADSEEDAFSYLNDLIGDEVPKERLAAYIKRAPEMLAFMEKNSLVAYEPALTYTDYYPEKEGGKMGGRSLDPLPYSRRKLGDEYERTMRLPAHGAVFDRFSVTAKEVPYLINFSIRTIWLLAVRMFLFYADVPFRLAKRPDNRLVCGSSLMGRLRKSLHHNDVPLWLETSAQELVVEQGRVTGLVVKRDGKTQRIQARKGVLIAAGGFEYNAEMRQQYQQSPTGNQWTSACSSNTGDGIQMAQQVGAQIGFMKYAWWTPALILPNGSREALIVGKSMPGCIMVNKAGKRFTNDAGPYEDIVKDQYRSELTTPSVPCYMIFDAVYRRNYPLGLALKPSKVVPDELIPRSYREAGWLKKANSLADLAASIDVDPQGLQETVERFNGFVRGGKDLDYGRGDSATDRYYSDHKVKPNSCLAEIAKPPFYAVEIYPGDLGTKGGLVCDEFSRVLTEQNVPIPGLYATGNSSASVMGNTYPGAGSTIGPSMTFGYIAALQAAKAEETHQPEEVRKALAEA